MANKKTKPPSRERYEKNNPTVSARLPVEIRDKLRSVLREMGMSLAETLTALANEQELRLKPAEEARKAAYEEARNLYMVTCPCDVCGKLVAITSPRAKEVVSKYMAKYGLGHAECHKKKPAS